ncbi:hypothetical protein, partial [Lentilactobacillus parabuchneri]|uniref:hypothetical protein n=1 Tax=Lentilactobacillus parabuchneri TaxID=152331 RepID=UPI001CDB0BD2
LLPRNIALVMMTKMLHMITNFFDSSLSNYWVKIKDTKQLLSATCQPIGRPGRPVRAVSESSPGYKLTDLRSSEHDWWT